MRGARSIVVASIMVGLSTGCVSMMLQSPQPGASFGHPPENYEAAVAAYYGKFDGYRYEIKGRPAKAYINQPLISGGTVLWQGYALPVDVRVRGILTTQRAALIFDDNSVPVSTMRSLFGYGGGSDDGLFKVVPNWNQTPLFHWVEDISARTQKETPSSTSKPDAGTDVVDPDTGIRLR